MLIVLYRAVISGCVDGLIVSLHVVVVAGIVPAHPSSSFEMVIVDLILGFVFKCHCS